MAKTSSEQVEKLLKTLRNKPEAMDYLNAALGEDTPSAFLPALKDVVKAHGGLARMARKTNLNRENMYRMLSPTGNPTVNSLYMILHNLGLKLTVEPEDKALGKK